MIRRYLSFVRFSHSVFALPFALVGALLAARLVTVGWHQVLWIVVAMVAARSAAMGFNRLVDARVDARNPRTAMRELPQGVITRPAARCSSSFRPSCSCGGRPVVHAVPRVVASRIGLVFWYSVAKRYTAYTQAFLGLAMAVAPVGGWLAAGGRGGWEPWLLGLAIDRGSAASTSSTACQDLEFDRAHGLRSIPVRFGLTRSILISRFMHALTVLCMLLVGYIAGLGPLYATGVALVGVLLVYEQSLVAPDDLSQVKRAFDLNGYVGILYLVTTAAAIYIR